MTITNAHFMTISGHFSANCMFIFHKTEGQTVILRCLTGLNLDWFKSYGLRCRWRPRTCLFYHHIWPFFRQLYVYLSQNLIGTIDMTQNTKTQKTQISVFVQNCKKLKMEIFAFCVITFEPIRF